MTTQAIATPLEAAVIAIDTNEISRKRLWAGRILTGLSGAFFIFDGGMKLFKPPVVVQATVQLGYPESTIVGIGIGLLACTPLYLIPRPSSLGPFLLPGHPAGPV